MLGGEYLVAADCCWVLLAEDVRAMNPEFTRDLLDVGRIL
jgi:hypothetical protein